MRTLNKLTFLSCLAAVLLLVGCNKHEEEETVHYGRTVMVYMAMQNSLGSYGFHRNDSTEIANAMAYIPENDRLLLFIDDSDVPRLYELSKGLSAPKLVWKSKTEASSAAAGMVKQMLQFMQTNYPSDDYGLVMGSHATGWIPTPDNTAASSNSRKTFGLDTGEGTMSKDKGPNGTEPDQIEIDDLAAAITQSGVHLRYLLFDACLMQCIEVDYALRKVTDFVIAPPISIAAEGAYYTDLVRYGLFSASAEDVAKTYASYYQGTGSIPYYSEDDLWNFYGTVISCVRTAGLEKLAADVKVALQHVATAETLPIVWPLEKQNVLHYQAYLSRFYYRPHAYDMLSSLKAMGIAEEDLAVLCSDLETVITNKEATAQFSMGGLYNSFVSIPADDQWCGVSMFVPQKVYTSNAVNCAYGDLNEKFRSTQWYKAAGWEATGW